MRAQILKGTQNYIHSKCYNSVLIFMFKNIAQQHMIISKISMNLKFITQKYKI